MDSGPSGVDAGPGGGVDAGPGGGVDAGSVLTAVSSFGATGVHLSGPESVPNYGIVAAHNAIVVDGVDGFSNGVIISDREVTVVNNHIRADASGFGSASAVTLWGGAVARLLHNNLQVSDDECLVTAASTCVTVVDGETPSVNGCDYASCAEAAQNLSVDPELVLPGYTLASTSPLVDAGADTAPPVYFDRGGDVRVPPVDIGPDEYVP